MINPTIRPHATCPHYYNYGLSYPRFTVYDREEYIRRSRCRNFEGESNNEVRETFWIRRHCSATKCFVIACLVMWLLILAMIIAEIFYFKHFGHNESFKSGNTTTPTPRVGLHFGYSVLTLKAMTVRCGNQTYGLFDVVSVTEEASTATTNQETQQFGLFDIKSIEDRCVRPYTYNPNYNRAANFQRLTVSDRENYLRQSRCPNDEPDSECRRDNFWIRHCATTPKYFIIACLLMWLFVFAALVAEIAYFNRYGFRDLFTSGNKTKKATPRPAMVFKSNNIYLRENQ